jgi:regulatory protein
MRPQNRKALKDDPDAAYTAALRLLARREHSARELGRKLEQRGLAPALIGPALKRLRDDGYLSDERFARSLARHRADQGYGELRICAELAQHGLEGPAVEQAIAELEADWAERALLQARRHFHAPPENAAASARILRHLAQRGFPSGVARKALADWAESVQEPG